MAGRPLIDISLEEVEVLLALRLGGRNSAYLLGISLATFNRLVREFGLTNHSFAAVSDDDLDMIVRQIHALFPNYGSVNMRGQLESHSLHVQRERVRESLRRVDPIGTLSRLQACGRATIMRREYAVAGPMHLIHMDGNHKLIR